MKIYQLTNASPSQMMGYVLITDAGKVIVIDGGTAADAAALRSLITQAGSHVDLWILTHPHYDHFEALLAIAKAPADITIDCIYYSPLPDAWSVHDSYFGKDLLVLNQFMKETSIPARQLMENAEYTQDNVTIRVLGVSNPDITVNAFNNSSCVLFVTEHSAGGNDIFRMVFLGDLGVEGGQRLLERHAPELKADAVQMAHHGQNGVSKEVYEVIGAKYAFWPTPTWLWRNTPDGQPEGSGPWKTLEVRAWMEKLQAVPVTALERMVCFDTCTKEITVL